MVYKMRSQGEEPSSDRVNLTQEKKGKRTSRVEAEKEGRILHPCSNCSKIYQSYPALYTHVKSKHPGLHISSANPDKKPSIPVHKLSGILKSSNEERDTLERRLINHLNYVNIELQKEFVKYQMIELALLGGRITRQMMERVQGKAKELGEESGVVDVILEQGMKEICREHFGLTGPISFGSTVLGFYCKNQETASKLWIQLALIGARDMDMIPEDKLTQQMKKLWKGQAVSVGQFLKKEWTKWKGINKDLLREDYPHFEEQREQFIHIKSPTSNSDSYSDP